MLAPRTLALLALLALAACRFPGGARLSEKAPSYAPFLTVEVDGQLLGDYLRARTRRVYSDIGEPSPRGDVSASIGAATAVAPDGYFLTAAHAALPPPTLVQLDPRVPARPARLVWDGRAEDGVDVALIHVEATLPHWFEWAADDAAVRGAPIVCAGFGDDAFQLAGGELRGTRVDRPGDDERPRVLRLVHDAPVVEGDSGGPLVTPDGRLLGVHTSNLYLPFVPGGDLASYAERPDPAWVQARIEADRAARADRDG